MARSLTLQELAAANAEAGPRTPSNLELGSVIAFFALCAALILKLWLERSSLSALSCLVAIVGGYVLSDFISGLVHWTFDTWGSPDTPLVGKSFIVPFRIHHVDPKDITRHGFVATNGHNCLASLPTLAAALLMPASAWGAFGSAFLLTMCLGIFGTNQFHKWAHEDSPSAAIRWLQRSGLILGTRHHDVHHAAPYAENYCITSGWVNGTLRRLHFFRLLERGIVAISGSMPRRDDLERTARR